MALSFLKKRRHCLLRGRDLWAQGEREGSLKSQTEELARAG